MAGTGDSQTGGGLGIHLNSANNANHNQAAPTLQLAVSAGGVTAIAGTVHSTANTTFTLQFFSNTTADPSGYGQGQTLLGSYTVTTDAFGNANFLAVLPTAVPIGQGFLTATATNLITGDTSAFAQDLATLVENTGGSPYIGVSGTLLKQAGALLPSWQQAGDLNLDALSLESIIALQLD